jgi:hypothetical protein
MSQTGWVPDQDTGWVPDAKSVPQETQFEQERKPENQGGFLKGAGSELWNQAKGTIKSLIPSRDNLYGLTGPGSPLSVPMNTVNAIQNWGRRAAEGRSLPYRSITAATEMAGIPTGAEGEEQAADTGDWRGVLGHAAVPALEAASPLIGEGISKIAPSKAAIASAFRDADTGRLKPGARTAARVVGGTGGHLIGGPLGTGIGAVYGPSVLDSMIPDLPPELPEDPALAEQEQLGAFMNKGYKSMATPPLEGKPTPFAGLTRPEVTRPGIPSRGIDVPNVQFETKGLEEEPPQTGEQALGGGITSRRGGNDLISRTRALVRPGEQPTPDDLKRAGDLTQAPLGRLQLLSKFGDELAKNEINRRLKNP